MTPAEMMERRKTQVEDVSRGVYDIKKEGIDKRNCESNF